MHRGHAGCGGAAGLRALDLGETALEHRNRRVAEAAILVVLHIALEGRLSLLGAVVDEARGEEHRLAGLAEHAALGAGMDQAGSGPVGAGSRGKAITHHAYPGRFPDWAGHG